MAKLAFAFSFPLSSLAPFAILPGSAVPQHGAVFPLAHGLIQTVRLSIAQDAVEQEILGTGEADNSDARNAIYSDTVDLLSTALQLSLSVVADVSERQTIDGLDEDMLELKENSGDSTPLNVNTAAIGANGTFSSVSKTTLGEVETRLAVQRVVVRDFMIGCISSICLVSYFL